jgi:hypothetical protein
VYLLGSNSKRVFAHTEASNQQQYGSFKVWTEARMYHAIVKRIKRGYRPKSAGHNGSLLERTHGLVQQL